MSIIAATTVGPSFSGAWLQQPALVTYLFFGTQTQQTVRWPALETDRKCWETWGGNA